MKHPIAALAASLTLAAVSADALNLEPIDTAEIVSQSCGVPGLPMTTQGRVERDLLVPNAHWLQSLLSSATDGGPLPTINLHLINYVEWRNGTAGALATRTGWQNSCTPVAGGWCYSNDRPEVGDYVQVTVTLKDGRVREHFYGDFSAGTTTSVTAPSAFNHTRTTYTQDFSHAFTYEELTNGFGVSRCEIDSIYVMASTAYTITAQCLSGPPSGFRRAWVSMETPPLNTLNFPEGFIACPAN